VSQPVEGTTSGAHVNIHTSQIREAVRIDQIDSSWLTELPFQGATPPKAFFHRDPFKDVKGEAGGTNGPSPCTNTESIAQGTKEAIEGHPTPRVKDDLRKTSPYQGSKGWRVDKGI
jgi:hypothetical protein